jgi:hypothetical protein
MSRAWKEIRLRPHPAVVLTERGQEGRTQRNVSITTAFPSFNAEHHTVAIDVTDFELADLGPPQSGAVECEQQGAVIEVLRAGDQALHLIGTEYHR